MQLSDDGAGLRCFSWESYAKISGDEDDEAVGFRHPQTAVLNGDAGHASIERGRVGVDLGYYEEKVQVDVESTEDQVWLPALAYELSLLIDEYVEHAAFQQGVSQMQWPQQMHEWSDVVRFRAESLLRRVALDITPRNTVQRERWLGGDRSFKS